MKKEKPVEVIQNKSRKHKTETRIFTRNIHETYCIQPGCKFRGKHAQQGVCHTTVTFSGADDWKYIDALDKMGADHIKFIKKHNRGKNYIKYLEGDLICTLMNSWFMLDELIRLRRKVALIEYKIQKLTRKKKSRLKRT